jgi:hypothetical protein
VDLFVGLVLSRVVVVVVVVGLFVQPLLPSPLHKTTGSVVVAVGFAVQPLLPSPLHNTTTGSFVVVGFFVGFLVVGANDGIDVGFFVVGANDGRAVGFFVEGLNVVGLAVLVVGLLVGDAVYAIPSLAGHSDGSGLNPVYALFTYLSRFVTLSYMLSQTTTPLESMT